MIFQKTPTRSNNDLELNRAAAEASAAAHDEVETVVGPSVNVEGDFASEGNIIVKGSVAGSVHTSRHLSVEQGAKILANVRAGSAKIAGEVKGNMKVKEVLELTGTAKVLGDIEVKTLIIEAGALICGKVWMAGLEAEVKAARNARMPIKKSDETMVVPLA
ncbi:MAG: polymer-forming cytoskeletal protein [Patescibacteria group bacterium]|jgi:cytoskeletal protein CcmA (bactofilin family)